MLQIFVKTFTSFVIETFATATTNRIKARKTYFIN